MKVYKEDPIPVPTRYEKEKEKTPYQDQSSVFKSLNTSTTLENFQNVGPRMA
jgi:hypothetical protein